MDKHPVPDREIKSSFNQEVGRPPTLDQKIAILENKIRPLESSLPEKDLPAFAAVKEEGEQNLKALLERQDKSRPALFDGQYKNEFQRRQQESLRTPRPDFARPTSPKTIAEAARKVTNHHIDHTFAQERLKVKVGNLERQHDVLKHAHARNTPPKQARSQGKEAFNKAAKER